jgi:phage tail-like protein
MSGWLVEQLPRCLATDPFVPRLVGVTEELADSVRSRIDGIEHFLDVELAPPEVLRWLGSWLGLMVEPSLPEDRQRQLVRVAGRELGWRGTRRGLERLVSALTGGPVRVSDGGGAFAAGEAPAGGGPVVVQVEAAGGVDERGLLAFIEAELPVGAVVELRVGPIGDERQTQEHPRPAPAVPPDLSGDDEEPT